MLDVHSFHFRFGWPHVGQRLDWTPNPATMFLLTRMHLSLIHNPRDDILHVDR